MFIHAQMRQTYGRCLVLLACYQYESSWWKSKRRAGPWRKSSALSEFNAHISTGVWASPFPPVPLLFEQWLSVYALKRKLNKLSNNKMNPGWSPINQHEQKGSHSWVLCTLRWSKCRLTAIINQMTRQRWSPHLGSHYSSGGCYIGAALVWAFNTNHRLDY